LNNETPANRLSWSFRGEAQDSTWLYRIDVNAASDWLRSRANHEARLTGPLPDESGAIDTAAVDIMPSLRGTARAESQRQGHPGKNASRTPRARQGERGMSYWSPNVSRDIIS